MNTAKKITLVSKSYTYDDIGQAVETEAYTYPFAWVRSASAREEEQAEEGKNNIAAGQKYKERFLDLIG